MTWVSSTRLVDYFDELEVVTLKATDDVPSLADARLGRVAGIEHTRGVTAPSTNWDGLTGPYWGYDWRLWDGADLVVPQVGALDLGDDFDMTITETTVGQTTYQDASVLVDPAGLDWSAFGGAPDDAALTVVFSFGTLTTTDDVDGDHEAYVIVDGDVTWTVRAFANADGTDEISTHWSANGGTDTISIASSTDVRASVEERVIVLTLHLPANTSSAIWSDSTALAGATKAKTGAYNTGSPPSFPDIDEPTISTFEAGMRRGLPVVDQGRPASGAFAIAFYRGVPATADLAAIKRLFGAWG
jgi:hypothetical protein